jgi:Uma2 family endonuclease
MSEGSVLSPITDRSLFSMHPEDWVTQQDSRDEQSSYLKYALRQLLPDCFVARDLAVYWVPGQFQHPYVGPDIFVSRDQPREEDPRAWLVWEDGPLTLVVEVASEKTRAKEKRKRDKTYAAQLQVPEYVYIDLERDELQLWRLVEGRYVPVTPAPDGRLWSRELGVGFVRREGERLVRVLTLDGEVVPTAQEEAALRREAEERADALAAEVERLRRAMGEGA